MKMLPLLGKALKDDDIMELLEMMDVAVVYDFDRLHENLPDVYWAKATAHGITMRFDQEQRLDVVFIYLKAIEGQTPIERSELEDVVPFGSVAEVEAYAGERHIAWSKGLRPAGWSPPGDWIRLERERYRVHYDFREGELYVITVCAVLQ
jgi:hypothetical protein